MPTIPTQLPKEITDKYSIVSNAFKLDKIVNAEKDKYKNEPKDEINIEIGDTKQTEFYPQVKLMRWTNETNFSIRLKDTEYEKAKISTLTDKIIWDKDNIKIEYYDYPEDEGGYKMVWYLKSKPITNKVEFSLQGKGLDFFYQSPLTQEYQSGYSEEFQKEIVVSETQVKDLEGNVLVERPENVVGSYAVYHSTKGGMNDAYGKEYKVGKAFHIFRPHLIDANGLEAWGNLHIENGIYSVEIPQDFLDKAVYPIKSNDNFGYETMGTLTTFGYISPNQLLGVLKTSPANCNSIDSITAGGKGQGAAGAMKGVVVLHSNLNIVANGVGGVSGTYPTSAYNWRTSSFSPSPTISPSTEYVLSVVVNSSYAIRFAYDVHATANLVHYDSSNSYSSPTNPTDATHPSWGALKYISIYATYTPSGGETFYQTLPATEIAVLTLSKTLTWMKLLSAIESSVASLLKIATRYRSLIIAEISIPTLSKIITKYKTLAVIEVSNVILSLLKTFYKALSVAESSIVNLGKGISKILSVVEISIISLSKITIFFKNLIVTEISISALSLVKTFYRVLNAIEVSTVSLAKGSFKILSVIESSIVGLAVAQLKLVVISIVESSVATISKIIIWTKSLEVVEVSMAGLSKIANFFKSMAVMEISVPSLEKIMSYFRSLAVVENSIAGLSRISSFFKSLTVMEISTATISEIASYFKNLIVTEISVPVISLIKTFYKTLSSISSSITGLIAQYIPGGVVYYVGLAVQEVSVTTIGLARIFSKDLLIIESSIVSLTKGLFKKLEAVEISIVGLVGTFIRGFLRPFLTLIGLYPISKTILGRINNFTIKGFSTSFVLKNPKVTSYIVKSGERSFILKEKT